MMKRRLAAQLSVSVLACVLCSAEDLLLDGFEGNLSVWGRNVRADSENVKEGKHSLCWATTRDSAIRRKDLLRDWSEYRALAWWMYSAKATGSKIILQVVSDVPGGSGGNYFVFSLVVDWEGWKHFEVPFSRFGRARSPIGWHSVRALVFNGRGWGQDKPVPGTRLCIDDLKLISKSEEELRAIREKKATLSRGSLIPLSEGQVLLEWFVRGNQEYLKKWTVTDAKETPGTWKLTWAGAVLNCPEQQAITIAREYDLNVSRFVQFVMKCRVSKGAELKVTLEGNGNRRRTERLKGKGTAEELSFPLQVSSLRGIQIQLIGGESEARALLESIILRPVGQAEVAVRSFDSRAVLIQWKRPSWSKSQYRLLRSADKNKSTDNVQEIAPGRILEKDGSVFDFPPSGGKWFYAAVPVGQQHSLEAGYWKTIDVPSSPVPGLPLIKSPIAIDANLEDWQKLDGALKCSINHTSLVAGVVPTSPDDLSARIHLVHDDRYLYLSADVTDDRIAHRNNWTWYGDGLVLLLGVSPPKRVDASPTYQFIFNYTAEAESRGVILQDYRQMYPADQKPKAPGTWAVRLHSKGYALEVAIPLSALKQAGFRPEMGLLWVGVSIYDSDQKEGETTRESAISWNQKKSLYDANDARLVLWKN